MVFLLKGENGECIRIGAHRLLLAGVSSVFKRMFFGPMKETREVIGVKDTSPESFRTMIKFIYARDPTVQVLYKIKSPKTIFELFALGDYYDILNLKTSILDSIPSWTTCLHEFEITRENLVRTVMVANGYRHLFVDLGTEVMMKCLKFYLDSTDKNFPGATDDIVHELMEVGRSKLELSGDFGEHFIRSLILFFRLGYPCLFWHRETQCGHDSKTWKPVENFLLLPISESPIDR